MTKHNLPHERYIAALERIKGQIESGLKLALDDSDEIGSKHTHASWGLCSGSAEQWPDAEDHLWPDQFKDEGRVAPLYRENYQFCPMDTRPFHTKPPSEMDLAQGCFYTCRLFNPGNRPAGKGQPRDVFPSPTREEAVKLYQITITRAKK
jgi:hypothetical protein